MLDVKYRFTCGDSDVSEIIKKYQNVMTRIVVGPESEKSQREGEGGKF